MLLLSQRGKQSKKEFLPRMDSNEKNPEFTVTLRVEVKEEELLLAATVPVKLAIHNPLTVAIEPATEMALELLILQVIVPPEDIVEACRENNISSGVSRSKPRSHPAREYT